MFLISGMSSESDLVSSLSYAELRRWAKHFGVKGRRKACKLRDSLQVFSSQIALALAAESAEAADAAPADAEGQDTSPSGSRATRRGGAKKFGGRNRPLKSPPQPSASKRISEDSAEENFYPKLASKIEMTADKTEMTADNAGLTSRNDVVTSHKTNKTAENADMPPEKIDMTADKADVTADKAGVTADKAGVTADKADVTAYRADRTAYKADMKADKVDMTADKADVPADKTDMTADKADMTADKADMTADKAEMKADKVDMTADEADVTADKADVTADKVDMTADKDDVIAVKADVTADGVSRLSKNVKEAEQASVASEAAENAAVASSLLTDDSAMAPESPRHQINDSQKENAQPSDYSPGQVSQHSAHSCFYVVEDDADSAASVAALPATAAVKTGSSAPNFAAIHARNAARLQESLADYQARKAARATYLLSQPVISRAQLETRQVTSTPQGRAAVTQTSPPPPPPPPPSTPLQPLALASPGSVRTHVCRSAYTPGSGSKRPKFDLQSSLSKPLTWVPHRGPLKPFAPDGPAYFSGGSRGASASAGGVGRKRPISAKEVTSEEDNMPKRKHLDFD